MTLNGSGFVSVVVRYLFRFVFYKFFTNNSGFSRYLMGCKTAGFIKRNDISKYYFLCEPQP